MEHLTRGAGARRTDVVCPREVVLAMGAGGERSRMDDALASGGWSVTAVDDGWSLLEHLARTLLGLPDPSAPVRPELPALVLLEIAVPGPRLGDLFGRLRRLFPEIPVLLVGAPRAGITERSAGLLLRGPFVPDRVLAAAAHAVHDAGGARPR